jgi:acyl transferase domain-containing protein/acyl carrier protein
MNNDNDSDHFGEIAIIGMAGRFPGARDVGAYWENLCAGVESISFFSDAELIASGVDAETFNHPNYVKAKGVLEGSDLFDAAFFGLNPLEAEIMDPQHRLFLECAATALESAGYDSQRYGGRIGVFAGAAMNTYLINILSNRHLIDLVGGFQTMLSNDKDYVPTLVSYKLNLRGPSVNVQTACSTSLVAVHLAYQSLLNGECDMALAGAVSAGTPQKAGYMYTEGGIHSPDGHCRAFDAQAQGTLDGEGVGIVILKRLTRALEDGDQIHAVIRASSINNDGAAKVGFTAPSVQGQSQVIAESLALAGIEPEDISYIETHGTATSLGDPIEMAALIQAFQAKTAKKGFCAIGSVKTNIGHLGAAAGMAGMIKTVLALENRKLPPSLHYTQPNPAINFADSPFYVNSTLSEWKAGRTPRRAGVSSFGIGGTNVHLIVEEAPPTDVSGESRRWQLILLSAKTEDALTEATANLAAHLKGSPELNPADVAYVLQTGRCPFMHRRMLVCRSLDEAAAALETTDPARVFTRFAEAVERPIAFMFPGGGAQHVQMAADLYREEQGFREDVDLCVELLQPLLGVDLRDLIYPGEGQAQAATERLKQTSVALPALFLIEYATARLWMSWGINPHAMIGHSLGEYAAACLAGVISLEDTLSLVALRGRLFDQLPHGAMLSVTLPENDLRLMLAGTGLSLAAINGPAQCVVSGSVEVIKEFAELLINREVECRILEIDVAAHSEMVKPILEPFRHFMQGIRLQPPTIPFVSNVTGTWITADEATDPDYWVRHLRETVRFADGVAQLLKEPHQVLLEAGPGRTLSTLTKLQKEHVETQVVLPSMRHPYDQTSDLAVLLTTLGELWLAGVEVDWEKFYRHERRQRMALPTYPFERQRYWVGAKDGAYDAGRKPIQIGKKSNLQDWSYLPAWKESVPAEILEREEVAEHRSSLLLFVDGGSLGAQLGRRLIDAGREVITVIAGDLFEKHDAKTYTLNPAEQDQYPALIEDLLAAGVNPGDIIHLWSATPSEGAEPSAASLTGHQNRGFYSLLFITQALAQSAVFEPLKILAVTTEIQEVTGDERLCPEKATLLGLCKVIPQEYPNISCRTIDISIPDSGSPQESQTVEALLAEVAAESDDHVVAYRGKRRWVQTYVPVPLGLAIPQAPVFREGGVYLITGGLGHVGLALAEHLARTVHARLILIGRSEVPPRREWEPLLEIVDEGDNLHRKLRSIMALEKLGAEVMVLGADVADRQQMRVVVARGLERFGAIHGVIHAAGIVEDKSVRTISELGRGECELQFRPKVSGVFVLEEVLQGIELDFCLLTSSLASMLGGLGYAAYAASNAFMDVFARRHNAASTVAWKSVNSDLWQAAEGYSYGESWSQLPMTTAEGVEVFRRALGMKALPQIAISTGDLQARIDQWINLKPLRERLKVKDTEATQRHARPNLRNAYVLPRNDVERVVAGILQERLGIENIGVHDNFFDLGGQSLLATQVVSALRDTFQIEISLRSLFEMPTVAGMGEIIEAAGQSAGVEVGKLARLMMQLDRLTEDEVKGMLAAR